MGFTIEPTVICAVGATIVAGPTVANMVEAKAKNPFITTTCKIIQLIPATLVFLSVLANKIEAHPFLGAGMPFSMGALCLSIPILFQISLKIAQRHSCVKLYKAIVFSEKIFMLAIKAANIAALVLMSMIAWQALNPLWITSCVTLIILNGTATIFCLAKNANRKPYAVLN